MKCEQCGKETEGRFCGQECEDAFNVRVNQYQARLYDKQERLEDRAEKQAAIAHQAHKAADYISSHIPFGQPILVGHHSERRHRRDLERIHNNTNKAFAAADYANALKARAANVGQNGISSDDPEALCKLKEKLADMEARREAMKAKNKEAAKAKTEKPYETWQLSNLGANIRRVKGRIEELEKSVATPEAEPVEAEGYRMEEDADDNRLRLFFDAKPCEEYRRILKSWGFRWAPSVGAWQRQLNNRSRSAAQVVLEEFQKYNK